jgi:hypothetical protein
MDGSSPITQTKPTASRATSTPSTTAASTLSTIAPNAETATIVSGAARLSI